MPSALTCFGRTATSPPAVNPMAERIRRHDRCAESLLDELGGVLPVECREQQTSVGAGIENHMRRSGAADFRGKRRDAVAEIDGERCRTGGRRKSVRIQRVHFAARIIDMNDAARQDTTAPSAPIGRSRCLQVFARGLQQLSRMMHRYAASRFCFVMSVATLAAGVPAASKADEAADLLDAAQSVRRLGDG